jgi:hypothetical protein
MPFAWSPGLACRSRPSRAPSCHDPAGKPRRRRVATRSTRAQASRPVPSSRPMARWGEARFEIVVGWPSPPPAAVFPSRSWRDPRGHSNRPRGVVCTPPRCALVTLAPTSSTHLGPCHSHPVRVTAALVRATSPGVVQRSPLHRPTSGEPASRGRTEVLPRGRRLPRHLRVPPSSFCTTSAALAPRWLRACCIPLPVLGLDTFRRAAKRAFPCPCTALRSLHPRRCLGVPDLAIGSATCRRHPGRAIDCSTTLPGSPPASTTPEHSPNLGLPLGSARCSHGLVLVSR